MLKLLVLFVVIQYPLTPDVDKTPGDLCEPGVSDFREYRYEEQIPYCVRNVSSHNKSKIYDSYNIPVEDRSHYTIDHMIPLSLGGSNDATNLWPEAKELKNKYRPNLEQDLFNKLSRGEITQAEAIDCMLKAKFELQECDVLPQQ